MELIEHCRRSYGMGTNPDGGVKIRVSATFAEAQAIGAEREFRLENYGSGNGEFSVYRRATRNIEGLPMGGQINPAYAKICELLGEEPA